MVHDRLQAAKTTPNAPIAALRLNIPTDGGFNRAVIGYSITCLRLLVQIRSVRTYTRRSWTLVSPVTEVSMP
jgi:hypothetical protein